LIAVLAISALRLRPELERTWRGVDVERAYLARDRRLSLSSLAGIDPSGQRVLDVLPKDVRRWVVVGLRTATLHDDVRYWSAVAAALPPDARIRLVGYCDSSDCRQALSQDGEKPSFQVLVYAEAVPSQAVASADAAGQYVLLDKDLRRLRRTTWRSPRPQPSETAVEIAK
jgi:hypothetical protein